jgi:hypothetical protein
VITKLGEILDTFPGVGNQTHCFAHTISISVKAILKQFDVPKKKEGKVLDKAVQVFSEMAQELDLEGALSRSHRIGLIVRRTTSCWMHGLTFMRV